MDYIDYRERLGLGFSDKEKQCFFITKVFSYLCYTSAEFSWEDEKEFCYQVGIKTYTEDQNPNFNDFSVSFNEPSGLAKLAYYLDKRKNEFRDFLAMLVFFLNGYSGKKTVKQEIWNDICKMLRDSHIQYDLFEENGKIFIFPKGAEELDGALVSQPLEWLADYPKSRTAFVKALELYSNSSDLNASDVADTFRKALETFFQEFFNSNKSLENLKSEYGEFLKSRSVPSEISNNFEKLLVLYTGFMNNYAKHHDKTAKNVLEYIMYQTGNIIRLLISLKNEEKDE